MIDHPAELGEHLARAIDAVSPEDRP